MWGNMSQGAPFIGAAILAFITLFVWMLKSKAHDEDGLNALIINLNMEQLVTLQALIKSIFAFIIIGVLLWVMP